VPAPVVRPARDDDASGVIALVAACFAEYDNCVLDLEHESGHLLRVASHYAGVDGRAWVATTGDGVVGCVACRPAPDGVLELQMLYVAAPERRRGLGASLVGLVEDEARRRGAGAVELWSDTRFLDAHRLYAGLGYERLAGTRELRDASDTVEFHFRKALPVPGSAATDD